MCSDHVQQFYLPLLEGQSGQVSPACSLKQRYVPPRLNVPLLFQSGQSPRSEEHLQEEDKGSQDKVTHKYFLKARNSLSVTSANICQLLKTCS